MAVLTKELLSKYLKENPDHSMSKIAQHFGCSRQAVSAFIKRYQDLTLMRSEHEVNKSKVFHYEKVLYEIADVGGCELSRNLAVNVLERFK